ncbi:protein NRT1/ PTR FAMILY 5.5 [Sesamum indicum]|uniref:Protein NRT1/ PTR FAMILY 5.5 n=1 Tax=Sesamum indicum TaxID=4182 RepID=A0A6I9UKM2_SESIN|nr:protein NRT1/ PTR FAMILY 5.5 [Sesamum indicum]XP_020553447.1 protein NRT1/ PTR FAMILY 5.5 [Sesamum indicum]
MRSFVRISALLWADILVGYAFFEMQNYLTDVWKLDLTHAAGILNIWTGLSMVLPAFFLFLVDARLGNFTMLVISSIAYTVGIAFVTMSTPPVLANRTGTCKQYQPECIGHTQKVLFYVGMASVAVGIAGNLVSVHPFREEQENKSNSNPTIDFLKIPGFILVVLIPVIGAIALPYIKPWSLRFGIPAICTAVATFLFLSGWRAYDKAKPQGSPVSNVCRVFVASAYKRSKPFPLDSRDLYRKDNESFSRTRFLRCLERAAIILPDVSREDQENDKWRLCSVSQVEEAKIAVRMVPMWLTFIICGIVSSVANTYFVEQANKMNRKVGKWKVPLQVLLLLNKWAKVWFGVSANRSLKKYKQYAAPIGIAIAMVFSVLCCITAARVETRRLNVIRRHGLLDKPDDEIPMSIFWLLFQFVLQAGLEAFLEKGVAAFYKDQAPDSMETYIEHFTYAVSGLGFMCSVLTVYVVGKISERGGKPNWFQPTLNMSRLDRYYWVLAALSSVNLLVFILVASMYRYKNREAGDDYAVDTGESAAPSGINQNDD